MPSDYILLHATRGAGLAPLETVLHVSGSFSLTTSAVITSSGPAPITFMESEIDRFKVSLDTAGIYYITATATNSNGVSFTDTIMILVMDRDQMNALLSAKWNGMVDSLGRGDINVAAGYFSSDIREKYASHFNLLKDHLSEIASSLHDLRLIRISEYEAEYSVLGDRYGKTCSF